MPEPTPPTLETPDLAPGPLDARQLRFYETFGFLRLPGLFRDEIDEIREGFEEAFAAGDPVETHEKVHFEGRRLILLHVVENSDRLRGLLDDDRILGIVRQVLGPDADYLGSDGNLLWCDTTWHSDIFNAPFQRKHLKIFFYLDSLRHDSGALRAVPGSHIAGDFTSAVHRGVADYTGVEERLGVSHLDLPSVTVDNDPGDVILGDFRTIHATFGGPGRRRLFTLNYRQCDPDAPELPDTDEAWAGYTGARPQ